MPPRLQPNLKTFVLMIKTHKLTVLTTVSQPETTTIADLKQEALSAITADVVAHPHVEEAVGLPQPDPEWEVPQVSSVDDFELCRAVKEKGWPTGKYEPLYPKDTVKQCVMNWDSLFIQFKNEHGRPLPVKVSLPTVVEEEDEEQEQAAVTRKGKQKAEPKDLMSDVELDAPSF